MYRNAMEIIDGMLPEINKVVGEGIAYHQMQSLEGLIDRLLQIAFRRKEEVWGGEGLPDDFQYLRYETLTPEESYLEKVIQASKRKLGKGKSYSGFNMVQSDTYMIRAIFNNKGDIIRKCIALPFIRRGSLTNVSGVTYGIFAVLKTKGLSLTQKGFFTAFPRLRVMFCWRPESFYLNGTTEHVYLPYSTALHNGRGKNKTSTKIVPPLGCWLFAKFGLKETFRKFLDTDIQIYDIEDPVLRTFDPSVYSVCTAINLIKSVPCRIAIVIKNEDLNPQAKALIMTVLYLGKLYPNRVTAEYADDNILWHILLGFTIFGPGVHESRIVGDIKSHFYNIEQMLDAIYKGELLSEGIECEDIWEFLYYVIVRITTRSGSETSEIANLFGRYYTTTEYVISDIIESIFSAHWELVKLARKTQGGAIATSDVGNVLNNHLKTNAIENIKKEIHRECAPFMSASDNMLIAHTSHCIDQTSARGGGKGRNIDYNDPQLHLHYSFVSTGSTSNLPKSNPIGFGIINSHVEFDPRGKILEKPHLRKLHAELEQDIKSKGI